MEHVNSSRASEEATNEMLGAHFIDVQEIIDVNEELQGSEQDINELRRRLCQAKTSYRQKRELHDCMFEDGLALEELINETAAENKHLTSKMKKLQQQMANIRKMWVEEDEEVVHQELLSEEESIIESQLIYIKKKEKENQKLREKNEDLAAEVNTLSVGDKYKTLREEILNLWTAEQEYKNKLKEVQRVLCRKDNEIEKKFVTLIKKNIELQVYFNTIEDLRRDQGKLKEELSSRLIAALNFGGLHGSSAMNKDNEKHKDERSLRTVSWRRKCTKALWKAVKVSGAISLCVLLSVGTMVSIASVCNNPDSDCNLWVITFELLEPYSQLHHMQPPVY